MLEQEDTPMLPGKPWKNEGYYPTFGASRCCKTKAYKNMECERSA